MKWEGREESKNVQDRRGIGMKAGVAAGGGGILLVILALIFGVDPRNLMGPEDAGPGPGQPPAEKGAVDPKEEEMAKFTKVIFGDTERVWDDLFRQMGLEYRRPTLVLYTGQVRSACGSASAAVGPFYCPGDENVYIDLSFYEEMERKLNAPGEFARAYVIAHEVGHHVQRLLGYSKKVDEVRKMSRDKVAINRMSVRLELQADYLAGVWGHHGQKKFNFLEEGDIESAINAAFEIGDDRLQRRSQGFVVPHSFTHGTSKQRMRWFKEGLRSGDIEKARLLFEVDYDEL